MEKKSRSSSPKLIDSFNLKEYHDSLVGGHSGIAKIVERICFTFYWPNMQKQIKEYVSNYSICQQAKVETRLPTGLL